MERPGAGAAGPLLFLESGLGDRLQPLEVGRGIELAPGHSLAEDVSLGRKRAGRLKLEISRGPVSLTKASRAACAAIARPDSA